MKEKGVIYARVSTKGQEEEGYSIPVQIKLLKEYAFKKGFQVVNLIDDNKANTPNPEDKQQLCNPYNK